MELFLSYARQDQPRAQALRGRLDQLGHSVWVDQRLTGGQQWWDEILRRIAAADALVMLVSSGSLRSAACAAERGYAGALGKPILPVLVEPLPAEMLPADVQLLQLVDYTAEGADSAIRLAGAVAQLRTAPPLPDPLPAPPPVPLSYLSQLGHKLAGAAPLTLEEQVAIAARLETATGAADAEERSTARHLLQALRQRSDLLAATQHIIDRAESAAAGRGSPPGAEQVSPAAGQVSPVSPAGQGEPPPEAARWQSPAPQAPRWDAPRQIAAPLAGPYPPGQPQAQRQYPTGPPTGMSGTTKAWLWIGGITAALVLLCLCAAILSSAQTGY